MLWASQMYLLYVELLVTDHIENLNSYFWCISYWIKQPLPEEEERGEMVDPKVEGLNIRSLNSQHTTSVMWRVLPQCVLFFCFVFVFKKESGQVHLWHLWVSPPLLQCYLCPLSPGLNLVLGVYLVTFGDTNGNGSLGQIELGCKIKRVNIGQIM